MKEKSNGNNKIKIIVLFMVVLFLAFVMDKTSGVLSDNTLQRNKTGDGDQIVDLILNANGLEKDYAYQLEVKEEIPSQKQADELFESGKKGKEKPKTMKKTSKSPAKRNRKKH